MINVFSNTNLYPPKLNTEWNGICNLSVELIIEEKPISYEGILKKMNLKVVDGKLSQDQPIKKNVYFYPQDNYIAQPQKVSKPLNSPMTPKQQIIKYLIHKINQKKRIAQIKSKKMYFL